MARITIDSSLSEEVCPTGHACLASGDVCPVINLSATLLGQHKTRMVAAVQESAEMLFEPVETPQEDAVPMEGEGVVSRWFCNSQPCTACSPLSISFRHRGCRSSRGASRSGPRQRDAWGVHSECAGGWCSMYAVLYLLPPGLQNPSTNSVLQRSGWCQTTRS
jgi:hypothetical protein